MGQLVKVALIRSHEVSCVYVHILFLGYFTYFEKLKEAYEITLLSVYLCPPPPPQTLESQNSGARCRIDDCW
jgi:hypothetical protein